ncbi:MAG: DUF2807 domain-containing protein [Bacteroidia bacterium]|nr:DUF2807 domain-containing protein [Bacteroidia bacterium]
MKNIYVLLLAAVTATAFTSCKKINGKGSVIKKTYTPGAFTMVDLEGSGDVVLVKDTETFVEVETNENVFDAIKVEVKDNHVILGIKKGYSLGTVSTLVYYVHAPSIVQVGLDGSGNIKGGSGGMINGNTFAARIAGSGNIDISDIGVSTLEGIIAGSGNMTLAGNVQNAKLTIAGSGNLKAFGVNSDVTDATISGSGNIETTTTQTLNAVISGSGDIRYKGTPTVNVTVGGSGNVVNAN